MDAIVILFVVLSAILAGGVIHTTVTGTWSEERAAYCLWESPPTDRCFGPPEDRHGR